MNEQIRIVSPPKSSVSVDVYPGLTQKWEYNSAGIPVLQPGNTTQINYGSFSSLTVLEDVTICVSPFFNPFPLIVFYNAQRPKFTDGVRVFCVPNLMFVPAGSGLFIPANPSLSALGPPTSPLNIKLPSDYRYFSVFPFGNGQGNQYSPEFAGFVRSDGTSGPIDQIGLTMIASGY